MPSFKEINMIKRVLIAVSAFAAIIFVVAWATESRFKHAEGK